MSVNYTANNTGLNNSVILEDLKIKTESKPNPQKDLEISNCKIIGSEELNAILFQLKNHYNELNSIRTKGDKQIKQLEEKNKDYNQKLCELEKLKDINIPSSNKIISIKDQGLFVESKEVVEKKIVGLMQKKAHLQENLTNEYEYSNTLIHMIDCEKKKMEGINKQIVEYEEKCTAIKLTRKNLEENESEFKKREVNYEHLKSTVDNEISKLCKVIDNQQESILKLNNELQMDKELLDKRKLELEQLEVNKKEELTMKKNDIMSRIKETQSTKDVTINKENYYIKLILGLHILQTYFLSFAGSSESTLDKFNEKDVLDSKEYKQFVSDRLILNETITVSSKHSAFLEKNTASKLSLKCRANNTSIASIEQDSENLGKEHLKRATLSEKPGSQGSKDVVSIIDIQDLKTKFEKIDIDFEKIYNFYTKLNSQISHYHSTMMTFNLKQINLESKKDIYTQKVKEILRKNYRNFDELIRSNSKFKNFMQDYQNDIKKEYENSVNIKLLEIDELPVDYSEFYFKCNSLISEFKAFFDFLLSK